jgi:hypothetical protein
MPHTPFDFLRAILSGVRTELSWAEAPDLAAWLDGTRLNLLSGLPVDDESADIVGLQTRFLMALAPALEKLDTFAAEATPRERARMFEPPVEVTS